MKYLLILIQNIILVILLINEENYIRSMTVITNSILE